MFKRGPFSAVAAAGFLAIHSGGVQAATITGWDQSNVAVAPTPADGVTGASVIYSADPSAPGATSSGQIVFTPPEAISPGIMVQQETYDDTGAGSTLTFDGCLMTSNPGATCTSGFQSGKRIKQQITGFDPVDLVFSLDNTDPGESFYQVFGRLINVTGEALRGFTLELGTGIGDGFQAFGESGSPISFSSAFTAQPNSSGLSSTTQFPFGLFGDADDSPNFLIDGFFAADRTGFTLDQTETRLTSTGYYGDYFPLFGHWTSQEDVPQGLFWDFDANEDTDNLLMAWQIGEDEWELRRDVGETCVGADCTFGVMLDEFVTGTYAEIVAFLSRDGVVDPWIDIFGADAIEDFANLNLNYALRVGDVGALSSFTIRTTVAPVPLPAAAPMLLAALGGLGMLRRRRRAKD